MSAPAASRREFFRTLAGGSLLLPGLVSELLAGSAPGAPDPLAARPPHTPARAQRVIFVFSNGGVSQMDTFDYKPALFAADGKKTGAGGGLSNQEKVLLRPFWEFRPGGASGTLVSDLFPHLRTLMDDICVIRSLKGNDNEHYNATLGMHTGSFFFSRPSIGSWVSYGLGTLNRNLPSFVALAPQMPYAGTQIFSNDFLPAYHQGVRVVGGREPIANLKARSPAPGLQARELELSELLNNRHLAARAQETDLAARIRSFETAFHMQAEAPDVFDVGQENDETLGLYGLNRRQSEGFGWQCLVARRLIERGVRFVEVVDGSSSKNWDQHGDMSEHAVHAKNIDRPLAGLLTDLKRRGLLADTLLVWTTEFGRTPGIDGLKGRGHHSASFSSWLAGAGVQGGLAYGGNG